MKNHLGSIIDGAIYIILLGVAALSPMLFFNQTTEFYDMPKLIFLLVSTLILVGLTIFSWIVKGKITITRTPLDIPLIMLLAVVLISTFFSGTKIQAIYGDIPSVHGSAIAWAVYIVLYFITVANLKTVDRIKNFLYVLYGGAAVVAFITLASFFGIFLPFDFAKTVNFTPTGSSFSTIALLTLLLPLPLISILNPNKYLPSGFAIALTILFGITVVLTGSIASYVILLIVFGMTLLASGNNLRNSRVMLLLASVGVIGLTLLLAYTPFPGNKIQQLASAYPKEIQLSFPVSWKVSVSAFRDLPFFGTGPSSYLFNFTSYKPAEFNLLQYWNVSFRDATNEFLQVLGTLGFLGFGSLLLLCIVVIKNSIKLFTHSRNDGSEQSFNHVVHSALAISGVVSIALLAIHASTLVSTIVTLFVLAVLMMSQESIREKEAEVSMGIKAATTHGRNFDLLPVVIFIAFLIGGTVLLAKTKTAVTADYFHRAALSQANKNGTLTYQYLQKAETLNPLIDLYRVDMAQTNFALANAIAVQKGPTKDNPQGTLTDNDKQTIQTLLSQAINEGRASVALNPRSSRNWEVLASIYRNITGVAKNSLTFSLDAYGKAIQRDPLNPTLRFTVGGLYYSLKNYDLAIRFFSDAINLKPDYVNAYYNLALAYREKNDVQSAKTVAEQSLRIIDKATNPQDYKIVTKLIADLDTALKEIAATQKANQQTGLNNQNLPSVNVPGLDTPPSVSTPSAVRANPNARIPSISPTRSPSVSPTATQ
ncbi:MAG: O-antigen ligase family protein [Patescibacteria group bacterium]